MPTDTLPVRVKSPLPDSQELLLHWMTGDEDLSRLFHFELELYCGKEVPYKSVLGHPLTVSFDKEGGKRHFNGIVTRFAKVGAVQRYLVYRAVLSPRLWVLQRTRDCRIFQNKTVPEVVQQVLGEYAVKFQARLQQKYRKIDYICQYRESAFAFVSRLMEQEGIYYYFKHTESEHELILSDALSSHDEVSGYEKLPVFEPGEADASGDHLTDWHESRQVRSARVILQEHDFRLRRGADIKATKTSPSEHDHDQWEIYDYPGAYLLAENKESASAGDTREAGEHYAAVQLEEQRVKLARIEGEGQVRGLETGALFRIDQEEVVKTQLLVVSTHHQIRNIELQSDGSFDPVTDISEVTFSAIDGKRPFRPERTTPKPVAAGPDTATVVGAKGEEIWTDKYGRVRIQFHWDRDGANDDSSTCWVRVSQIWSGAQWGAQFIPRIGHEVVVQYLGGDPDRPIITGSVYNADNLPPYALPDNATQSGIKTRSSKGGAPDNFNEIRFEDKKGAEELHIQAERDQSTKVKRNQSISVDADRSVSVGGNETISVTGTRSSTITKKETQTFKDDRSMTVAKTNTDEITLLHTGKYNGGRTETVTKGDTLEVMGSNKVVTVHGEYNTVADTQFQVMQAGNKLLINKKILLDNQQCSVELLNGVLTIKAADQIRLECGGASVTLKKDGSIDLNGSQKVVANGGGSGVQLNAVGATMSGAKASVSGTAMTEITGGMVRIN